MNRIWSFFIAVGIAASGPVVSFAADGAAEVEPPRMMEYLDRGLIALIGDRQVYIGWRLLATDPLDVAFDVYRRAPGIAAEKLNAEPITGTTDFIDSDAGRMVRGTRYFVVPLVNGEKGTPVATDISGRAGQPYLPVRISPPDKNYSANDCSAADLDGDGRYEIIVKWDPNNARDNSQGGITGNVYLDAYTLDGKKLWRIDLGPNIRAGAHYTQFMVYDLDSDGRAELVCKTADKTVDGRGKMIGRRKTWRSDWGNIVAGPEFLTCFDGRTGAAISTTNYVPYRVKDPANLKPSAGEMKAVWGDGYGNRSERYLAGVAYLDGIHPSVVMCRGYYSRSVLAAWDLVDGALKLRWVFDSDEMGGPYGGQGNHSLIVGDVDGDGRDEITYGAMCVDDDGTGLYTTGMGHGDAAHMSDLDPERHGQEVWTCQEHPPYGASLRDAATGEIIKRWESNRDTGRACAADVDPRYPGYEMWAAAGCPLHDAKGNVITNHYRLPMNFVVNWDGDDLQELLDGTRISKYNWETGKLETLLDASEYDCRSNNGSKATPCLSADLFGDYREEVVWRTDDSRELRIFTTTIPAQRRLVSLMQDPQYRLAIAWQNVGYNQPPHPSFFMGAGMETPPRPNIEIIKPNRKIPDRRSRR